MTIITLKNLFQIFPVFIPGRSSELCFQSAEAGPCKGHFPRWFYNSTTERCETFIYGGCSGNQNRFETREKCENACGCGRFMKTSDVQYYRYIDYHDIIVNIMK